MINSKTQMQWSNSSFTFTLKVNAEGENEREWRGTPEVFVLLESMHTVLSTSSMHSTLEYY